MNPTPGVDVVEVAAVEAVEGALDGAMDVHLPHRQKPALDACEGGGEAGRTVLSRACSLTVAVAIMMMLLQVILFRSFRILQGDECSF